MRTLVRQPAESHFCGHACIAMICEVSFEEALRLCLEAGIPQGLTRAAHLRRVLDIQGFVMGRCERMSPSALSLTTGKVDLDGLWICRMRWPDTTKTHWVVVEERTMLDPGLPDPKALDQPYRALLDLPHDNLVAKVSRATKAYLSSGYSISRKETS